jgi:hypothetical protein
MTAIIVITFNIPASVFLLQVEAIQKLCLDKYELVIIDNSDDSAMGATIAYHSNRLGVPYIRTNANTKDSSFSHAFAANMAYRMLQPIEKYSHMLFLDHDCIPVKPFSVPDILGKKYLAALAQNKCVTYPWPGCLMWDNSKIPGQDLIDFSPSRELQLDTGGELHKLVGALGRDNCYFFDEVICKNNGYQGSQYDFYNLLCSGRFMHFVNASNWNPVQDNEQRLNSLINIARGLMENK